MRNLHLHHPEERQFREQQPGLDVIEQHNPASRIFSSVQLFITSPRTKDSGAQLVATGVVRRMTLQQPEGHSCLDVRRMFISRLYS